MPISNTSNMNVFKRLEMFKIAEQIKLKSHRKETNKHIKKIYQTSRNLRKTLFTFCYAIAHSNPLLANISISDFSETKNLCGIFAAPEMLLSPSQR